MKHITSFGTGVVLLLSLAGMPASAQSQSQSTDPGTSPGTSLGDYARQVKKDPDTKGKARVFDNDNLPKDDKLSVVGAPSTAENNPSTSKAEEPASTTASEAKPAADAKASSNPGPVQGNQAERQVATKQWSDKLDSQQQQIDLLQRELDVLQREYQIRAAAMYADAGNRMRNSADWDKQDTQYKQQIADKQKALDEAKQKLDDLKEDARKSGVPSSVREP